MKKLLLIVPLLFGLALVSWAQPTLTNISPARNALDVAIDANIEITYSADMDALEMIQPNKVFVKGSLHGLYSTYNSYSAGPRVLTINPDDDFLPGELITVTVMQFLNFANNANSETITFSFRVATTGTGEGFFSSSTSFGSMVSSAYDLTFGDLDGDGDLDVVAMDRYNEKFYILRKSNGVDSYITPDVSETYTLGGGNNLQRTVLHDMDNDGDLDIVLVVNPGSGTLSHLVYSNNGSGTFTLPGSSPFHTYLPTTNIYNAVIANWTNSNHDDIFITADNVAGLWLFSNNLNGTYTEGSTPFSGIQGRFAVTGDFNNDRFLDFAVIKQVGSNSSPTNDSLGIILSNGSGGFTNQTYNIGSTQPWGMDVGDMDGDGYLDLIINADSLYIFDNDNDGTFTQRTIGKTYSTDNVKVGDVNGDGSLDIAILSSTMTFYFNDGSGNFPSSYYVSRGYSGLKADLGDADEDGDLDVIYAVNGGITVYKNGLVTAPTSSATLDSFTNNWGNQIKINWTAGNGGSTLVIAKEASAVDASPVDNTVYTANSNFGDGSEITSGNFVVYDGNGTSATVTGLSTGTTYHFKVIEFNSTGTAVVYRTSVSTGSVTMNAEVGYDFSTVPGKAMSLSTNYSASFYLVEQTSPFTIEFWAKPTLVNTAQVLAYYGEGEIEIGLGADNLFYATHANGGGTAVELTGTITAVSGTWYHIALSAADAGTMSLVINGTLEDSDAITTASADSYPYWGFASNWAEDSYFTGLIDEVRFWSEVRSISTIRTYMFQAPTGFPANLVYYWQFGDDSVDRNDKVSNLLMNVNQYDGVANSDLPFGQGVINTAPSVSTGSTTIGNATLTLADDFDNPVDVQVTEFDNTPASMPGGYSFALADKYFIIELFGDPGIFSVNLTLTLGADAFSTEEINDPSLLKLYKRSSTSTGAWTLAASGISTENTAGQVVFNGITSFSQFVVTSGDPFYLLGQTDTSIVVDVVYYEDGTPVILDESIFQFNSSYLDSTLTLTVNDNNFNSYLYVNAHNDGGDEVSSGSSYSFKPNADSLEYWPYNFPDDDLIFTFSANRGSSTINVKFILANKNPSFSGDASENEWQMVSNPFDTSYGTFLSDIWTQGIPNSDGPNGSANLFTFNADSAKWSQIFTDLDTTKLSVGAGVLAYMYADDDPTDEQAPANNGWPKTFYRSGTLRSATTATFTVKNVDFDESTTLNGDEGWMLIGNPFALGIDTWDFITAINDAATVDYVDGVSQYVYAWNPVTESWIEADYGSIPAYQSVFVRMLFPGAEHQITINSTILSESTPFTSGGGGGGEPKLLKPKFEFALNHANTNTTSKIEVKFNEKSISGIDSKDAFYLWPLANSYANLFFNIEDQSVKINSLPLSTDSELNFPIYMDATLSGEFTLNWPLAAVPEEASIYLVEVASGKQYDLHQMESLTFSYTATAKKQVSKNSLLNRESGSISTITTSAEPVFILKINPFTTSAEETLDLPKDVELAQNYPNPFNPTATIQFGVPQQAKVTLEVFDVLGRKVRTLVNETKAAGRYSVRFDAQHLSSGLYFYRLVSGQKMIVKQMTLIK